jgi:hypothetical protein
MLPQAYFHEDESFAFGHHEVPFTRAKARVPLQQTEPGAGQVLQRPLFGSSPCHMPSVSHGSG